MLINDGTLTMSPHEWEAFQRMTFAPWRPRTQREFDAMAELGAARHVAENTGGMGFVHAMACEDMRFGPNGEMNFPPDQRRLAYCAVHGTWPTDDELKEFEGLPAAGDGKPGLRLV